MKNDYVSVVYDKKRTPKTDYPHKLISYLIKKFNLSMGKRILEIGCGRGDFLDEFHKAGFECFGIDREKRSAELLPHINIEECDISKEKLPFDNNTFDIVYHKSLIEHLYDPSNLMSETCRVLKDGGKLIVLTPDWVSQIKNFYEDYTHSRPYTSDAIKDLFSVFGFNNIVVKRFYQLPFLWKYPVMTIFSKLFGLLFSVNTSRWLTHITGIKYFRWSVELMILGYGEKTGRK